uniref:Ig-like domain-containing protein n=1 Tax=Tatumella sp. UCD-D_suzukii TaxID=1408192 RepID=UPI000471940B
MKNLSLSTAVVINKTDGLSKNVNIDNLVLSGSSVVKLHIDPATVRSFERHGNDLTIVINDGHRVVIKNFFVHENDSHRNELILEDGAGVYWWGQYTSPWSAFTFTEIEWHDGLPIFAGLAGAGLLGLAALLAGGHGHNDQSSSSGHSSTPLTASAEPLSTNKGTAVGGRITVQDPDSAAIKYTLEIKPSHGTVELHNDGSYTFTPASGFSGQDAFTVLVRDANGATVPVKIPVTVHVGAVDDMAVTKENTPVSGNVLTNDTDKESDPVKVTQFTVDGHTVKAGETATLSGVGTLTIDSDGKYTFTPATGYTGPVPSATYTITDGHTSSSATLSFSTINTPPVANNDTAVAKENTPVSGNVLTNDTDKDGDTLTVTQFTVDGQTVKAGETATISGVGTLTIGSDGKYTFTPVDGYTGKVPSATYTVTDGQATSTATLSFSTINTPPVANNDTAVAKENTPVSGNVLTNDTDKDGDTLTVTQFTVDGQTVKAGETATISGVGTLTIGSDGKYTFTPVDGYTGKVPSATY